MFGLGFSEIVVILVVALLVLGPRKLPDVARQVGKAMRDLRRAASDFQTTLDEETRPSSPYERPYVAVDPMARPHSPAKAGQSTPPRFGEIVQPGQPASETPVPGHPAPKEPAG